MALKDVFSGCSEASKIPGMKVELVPMSIERVVDGFGKEEVPRTGVVCIETRGKIADYFFVLNRADGLGKILVVNERKKGMASLGQQEMTLVSMIQLNSDKVPDLPENCILVSGPDLGRYHGCMELHPASDPRVFVNRDNQSQGS